MLSASRLQSFPKGAHDLALPFRQGSSDPAPCHLFKATFSSSPESDTLQQRDALPIRTDILRMTILLAGEVSPGIWIQELAGRRTT